MISRTVKKLTNSIIYYGMSSKKTTEQWKKPVQQLKKQKQQNSPLPRDTDQSKKAARQWVQKETQKLQTSSQRGLWNKKQRKQRQVKQKTVQNVAQKFDISVGQQGQNKQQIQQQVSILQNKNWFQVQQLAISKQQTDLINQAVKFFKLKYSPQLKETLKKINEKYNYNGLQLTLNNLFNIDHQRAYEQFKSANFDLSKINVKVINNIIFNLASNQQLTRLEQFLTNLKKSTIVLDFKHQELFDIMFYKQTGYQFKLLTGQNSVNFSIENRNFVKKIQIAYQYLRLLQQHGKKKKGVKKATNLPLWLDKVTKLVLKYKCGVADYRNLFNQIVINHDYIIPQAFFQTQQFAVVLKQLYFGNQSQLPKVFELVTQSLHKIKFKSFFKNLTEQLMLYRTENKQPAFQVDEFLIQTYKKTYQTKHKYTAMLCCIFATDAKYSEISEHYVKYYMQGFPNQKLDSQDTKIVQQHLLNIYDKETATQKQQKKLNNLVKHGSSTLLKLKAAIKLGNLTAAYKIFQQDVYRTIVIAKSRKVIQYVLRNQLNQQVANYLQSNETKQFMKALTDEYLWSLHQRNQDLSLLLKQYIPQNKQEFWQNVQQKQRFQQISVKLARGQLKTMKQPSSDINSSNFNLQQYMQNEFPQLRELQIQKYEVQKQLIKYTLKIQGAVFMQRIHDDWQVAQVIKQAQQGLNEQNLAIIQSFGLKDYNILEFEWDQFLQRFQKMKLYKYIVRDEKLDWQKFENYLQRNKSIKKKNILEQMMIKKPQIFRQAQSLVKLPQEKIVDKLILWGVYSNEPMAVYLAQKLAMQTGQLIPDNLAWKVSQMLSYKRPLSQQFIARCKQCLRVLGKINREYIYSLDKQYEHILIRKSFHNFVQKQIQQKKRDNRQLQDLISFNPRPQLNQRESKLYLDSIKSRAQYVA